MVTFFRKVPTSLLYSLSDRILLGNVSGAGNVGQLAECLPSLHEVLGTISSSTCILCVVVPIMPILWGVDSEKQKFQIIPDYIVSSRAAGAL